MIYLVCGVSCKAQHALLFAGLALFTPSSERLAVRVNSMSENGLL